jgi:chromosome partitioning protein
VLAIDLDPQGALTAGVGLAPLALTETIYHVLTEPGFAIERTVTATRLKFDLLPANLDLAAAEFELVAELGREQILKQKLAPLTARYDFIFIDCPPSLGILTINALAAASAVIVPVQPQYFALRGMELLFKTIERIKARINPGLEILGILPTICDARTRHTREALEELTGSYGRLLFETIIPQTIKLPDSAMAGTSVLDFAADSPAAHAYRKFAQEVLTRAQ